MHDLARATGFSPLRRTCHGAGVGLSFAGGLLLAVPEQTGGGSTSTAKLVKHCGLEVRCHVCTRTPLLRPRRNDWSCLNKLDFGGIRRRLRLLGDAEQECRSFRKPPLMFSDALESFIKIFSPSFRTVMWKSLGLTAIVLFLLGLGLDRLASSLMPAGGHAPSAVSTSR